MMDAIQGAGGMNLEAPQRTLGPSQATEADDAPQANSPRQRSDDTQTMGAVLSLSRQYVSAALQECGFVDITATPQAASDEEVESGSARSDRERTDLDARIAAEIAAHFGQQVAGSSIDAILEIMSRPDPRYVVKLLA